MKRLFGFLLMLNLVFQASANTPKDLYVIQLGAFNAPQAEHFQVLAGVGMVYLESLPSSEVKRVLLGRFEDKSLAERTLQKIHAIGFEDAILTTRTIETLEKVYTVQVASQDIADAINTSIYEPFGDVFIQIGADKVRILVGNFTDLKTANDQLQKIRNAGTETAFLKFLEKGLIQKVGTFEKAFLGLSATSTRLPVVMPKKETISTKNGETRPSLPANYDEKIDRRSLFPTRLEGENTERGSTLDDEKKKSVLELQKALKAGNWYNGDLDGVYNEATRKAFEAFTQYNERYVRYDEIHRERPAEYATKGDYSSLQGVVEMMEVNPTLAAERLPRFTHPLSAVYLAYLYFTGEVATENPSQKTDELMNDAIRRAFFNYSGKPRFDYQKTHHYETTEQLLQHLAYIYDATTSNPDLPCWLVENHNETLTKVFAGLKPPHFTVCEGFDAWKEVRILKAMAEDLDPRTPTYSGVSREAEKQAYTARSTELFGKPTPPLDGELELYETWNANLWNALDAWAAKDPLHEKMVAPFKITYFALYDKLENHYTLQGFDAKPAKALSISALYAFVNYYLGGYITQ